MSESEKKAIEILKDNQEFFKSYDGIDWLVHICKSMGWYFTKGLYKISVSMEKLLNEIVTFGGLLNNKAITNLSETMMPIVWAVFGLTILIIGLSMMFGKQQTKLAQIAVNSVLAICFIITLPTIFSSAYKFSQGVTEVGKSINGGDGNLIEGKDMKYLSTQIVAMNTTDLYWLAQNDFKKAKNGINNDLTDGSFTSGRRQFGEKINPGMAEDNKKKKDIEGNGYRYYENIVSIKKTDSDYYKRIVFNNNLVTSSDGKTNELSKISDGFGKSFFKQSSAPFSNYYQRYQTSFFFTWLLLGTLIAVQVFTSFKVVRLSFEIAFQKVIAPWVAATDLNTLQRVKQLLSNIVTNYAVIGLVLIIFKMFMILTGAIFQSDLSFLAKVICYIGLAIAVVDGPNEAKKILGIDTGVKDGQKSLMAGIAGGAVAMKAGSKMAHMTGATKATSAVAQGGKDLASNIGHQAKGGVGTLGGYAKDSFEQSRAKGVANDLGTGTISQMEKDLNMKPHETYTAPTLDDQEGSVDTSDGAETEAQAHVNQKTNAQNVVAGESDKASSQQHTKDSQGSQSVDVDTTTDTTTTTDEVEDSQEGVSNETVSTSGDTPEHVDVPEGSNDKSHDEGVLHSNQDGTHQQVDNEQTDQEGVQHVQQNEHEQKVAHNDHDRNATTLDTSNVKSKDDNGGVTHDEIENVPTTAEDTTAHKDSKDDSVQKASVQQGVSSGRSQIKQGQTSTTTKATNTNSGHKQSGKQVVKSPQSKAPHKQTKETKRVINRKNETHSTKQGKPVTMPKGSAQSTQQIIKEKEIVNEQHVHREKVQPSQIKSSQVKPTRVDRARNMTSVERVKLQKNQRKYHR